MSTDGKKLGRKQYYRADGKNCAKNNYYNDNNIKQMIRQLRQKVNHIPYAKRKHVSPPVGQRVIRMPYVNVCVTFWKFLTLSDLDQ